MVWSDLAMIFRWRSTLAVLSCLIFACVLLGGCGSGEQGDPELTRRTTCQLVDWHISGLMIINAPVAWLRVTNYNSVPIKDVTVQYNTYDTEGHPLSEGTYTIEGVVQPGTMKNFIELYLGIVDLHSERLTVKLLSVSPA